MDVKPRYASRLVSVMLTGLCFAMSAAVTIELPLQQDSNPVWRVMAFPVAIGTFLTTLLVWKPGVGRAERSLLNTSGGALIGVLAHPVSAVCYVVLLSAAGVFGFPGSAEGAPLRPSTIATFFEGLAFVLFWWCALAACDFGWVTIAVGAVRATLLTQFSIFPRLPLYCRLTPAVS